MFCALILYSAIQQVSDTIFHDSISFRLQLLATQPSFANIWNICSLFLPPLGLPFIRPSIISSSNLSDAAYHPETSIKAVGTGEKRVIESNTRHRKESFDGMLQTFAFKVACQLSVLFTRGLLHLTCEYLWPSQYGASCHYSIINHYTNKPLCYDASVRLSVTEVHWRTIANLGFKFRSHFTAHCGRRAAGGRRAACGRIISRHASQC